MPFYPTTRASRWQKQLQEGKCIDSELYSLKHKEPGDMIYAGIPKDGLRPLSGHQALQMTEIYLRAVRLTKSVQRPS